MEFEKENVKLHETTKRTHRNVYTCKQNVYSLYGQRVKVNPGKSVLGRTLFETVLVLSTFSD